MKQVCYYWIPQDGKHGGNLTVEELDPTICTHIVIAGARIENNTIIPLAEDHPRIYREVVSLKKGNPNLYVLLCVANGFSTLVREPEAVAIFAFNAKLFLEAHGLDGIDLDWEFPAWPSWQRDARERKWFTYLVMQLNNALKLASHPPLMLSIAVGAPQNIIDTSYEVEELAKYVDYVSVMGYDYHMYKPYLPFTGHNAPLSRHSEEVGFLSTLNIEWATKYWLLKGMPKEKLVVGIPTYGRTWRLLSKDWFNVGAPAVDAGLLNGEVTYMEACIFIKEGATRYFDGDSHVPFAVRETDWVSFEDPQSIQAKVICSFIQFAFASSF
ncbi:putative glycosyl hydrolase 18 [Halocaridina rubra]|uniref:Glycosyl hydrolase 18 n=1 Tax=Halocaridina rubra TaxID=373956 RepID=A0AAN8WY15_HALRR